MDNEWVRELAAGPARRFGVIGWPVSHSLSPKMHTAVYQQYGLDSWSYQKLPVDPRLLAEVLPELAERGFYGVNVTIPHKEAVLGLVDKQSPSAAAIGSANTLTFKDGEIFADNTDAPGLTAAIGEPLAGKSAVVLGAGGSARAVVWALREAGVKDLKVWNRTAKRAEELCKELGGEPVERLSDGAEVLINCTAVGLNSEDETFSELPIRESDLMNYGLIVDLVYREQATELISAALKAGCKTVDGKDFLASQGALSFAIWTALPAPYETMRAALG